jgi:hypothetical protein
MIIAHAQNTIASPAPAALLRPRASGCPWATDDAEPMVVPLAQHCSLVGCSVTGLVTWFCNTRREVLRPPCPGAGIFFCQVSVAQMHYSMPQASRPPTSYSQASAPGTMALATRDARDSAFAIRQKMKV